MKFDISTFKQHNNIFLIIQEVKANDANPFCRDKKVLEKWYKYLLLLQNNPGTEQQAAIFIEILWRNK